MVQVSAGVLVRCDPPMKQYLLYLDDKRLLGETFVIKDLDENHLLISDGKMDQVQEKIDELMNKNSFAVHQQN